MFCKFSLYIISTTKFNVENRKGKHIMKQILTILVLLCGMMANSYAADYSLNQKEIVCLATNQFFEVNGTSRVDYQLVTSTVLTRAALNGKTPCKVIREPKQFSWVGKKTVSTKARESINDTHVPNVIETARLYVDGLIPKVTHFHNNKIKPKWAYDPSFKLVRKTKAQTYYVKIE